MYTIHASNLRDAFSADMFQRHNATHFTAKTKSPKINSNSLQAIQFCTLCNLQDTF